MADQAEMYLRIDGKLVALRLERYDSEAVLQGILADHPDQLLVSYQYSPEPLRWLLLGREYAIGLSPDDDDRWSIDHVFIDHKGVPTIVEVKQGHDSHGLHAHIGQPLTYAANAVHHWTAERLRARFIATLASPEDELAVLRAKLGDVNQDEYWTRVEQNLRAGTIRLIYLADAVGLEHIRVLDFLNERMAGVQVLAIEVRQFVGETTASQTVQVLVPRLVSQPPMVRQVVLGLPWDEARFYEALPPATAAIVRRICDWAVGHGFSLKWGGGSRYGTCGLYAPVGSGDAGQGGQMLRLMDLSTASEGWIEVRMKDLRNKPIFSDLERRKEYLTRLSGVKAFALTRDNPEGFPGASLAPLADEEAFQQFIAVLEWARQQCLLRGT